MSATLAGFETGLRPVNVMMATVLFVAALLLFDKWYREVST